VEIPPKLASKLYQSDRIEIAQSEMVKVQFSRISEESFSMPVHVLGVRYSTGSLAFQSTDLKRKQREEIDLNEFLD